MNQMVIICMLKEGDTLYVEYVDTTLPRVGANGELNSKSDTLDIIATTSVTIWIPVCHTPLIMSILESVTQKTQIENPL